MALPTILKSSFKGMILMTNRQSFALNQIFNDRFQLIEIFSALKESFDILLELGIPSDGTHILKYPNP